VSFANRTGVMHDAASVLIDGPWHHRFVSANGARFHVAEMGDGPMVLLLHGFPQFWYAWRHQMAAIADAGWRAVAMDLRGYGASDKPPRGYDTYTSTADAATVIRSLGEDDAIVIGHGLGGFAAWAMPSLQPGVTRAIGSLSMPHPRVIRRASLLDGRQRRASRYLVELQRPFGPERAMARDDAYVADILRAWASPYGEYPGPEDVTRYADAMALPFVAHSAAEHYRWLGRSQVRQDGPLFNRRIRGLIEQPVLHLQGTEDGCVVAAATAGSAAYVSGPYTHQLVDGAGHFLPEEAPERVSAAIVDWLDTV
jgi:pimeloyl-ACP methyl ester carboxylesterase